MTKITSFEDLKVWQKARELVRLIYKITAKFPREEKFSLTDQIRRATVSVMANIAEGFSRYHLAETVMKSHLYVALDLNYINRVTFDRLIELIDEIGKMTNGLINSTESYRSKLSSNN